MSEALSPEVVHEYEHQTWSRCAGDYLDGFAGLTRPALPLLVEAAAIVPGMHVLEVGSGPGHISAALTETGAQVTGVDFSAAMVKVARKSFPMVRFEEADACALPFEDASFDAVVYSFVVHHLARPEAALREACRVLKTGGRVSFSVFADPAAQSSIGAFFSAVAEHHDLDELPHGPLFGVTDLGVYKRFLGDAGLAGYEFATRKLVWHCDSAEAVLRSFWNWGAMDSLPNEVQRKIEATTRLNLQPYATSEGYAMPHEVLIGSARKA